jgi:hypothetical protein
MLRTAGGNFGWFFSGPDRQVRSRMPSAKYDGWPEMHAELAADELAFAGIE